MRTTLIILFSIFFSVLSFSQSAFEKGLNTLNKDYLFRGKKINRWYTSGKRPRKHRGKGYSDHLPVLAKFLFKPIK